MLPSLRRTQRLELSPIRAEDLDSYVALQTELRGREDPPRPPADRPSCAGYLAGFAAVWERGELGYWTLRRDGEIVGFGGVKPKRWRERDVWNLYYQLFPRSTGLGLATELARAALDAAAEVRPDWPVLVETRPSNGPALAVAVRAGLTRRPELDDDGWAVLLREPSDHEPSGREPDHHEPGDREPA